MLTKRERVQDAAFWRSVAVACDEPKAIHWLPSYLIAVRRGSRFDGLCIAVQDSSGSPATRERRRDQLDAIHLSRDGYWWPHDADGWAARATAAGLLAAMVEAGDA